MTYKLDKSQMKELLRLDNLYNDFYLQLKRDWNNRNVLNYDEEMKKFLKLRKDSKTPYFPQLKMNHPKVNKELLNKGFNILYEFENFDNFLLKKYYIELLNLYIGRTEYVLGIKDHNWFSEVHKQTPLDKDFIDALNIIKENPYQNVKENANISSEETKADLQKYINKQGYDGWEVVLDKNLIPRMCVQPDKTLHIKTDAKFSKIDIESLKAHEIDTHIARRYYGAELGLNLFKHGLIWQNVLNEGMAIYNTINNVSEEKPNMMLTAAILTVIAYQLDKMNFCEIFDYVKELSPEFPDENLFEKIVRSKRELVDCSLLGGNGDDMSYLCGYNIVKKLDNETRNDIIKYNIGPAQIKDLPKIKEFFEINKFTSLNK